MFLMLFCSNSAHFSEIQLVCDPPTEGRTDTPSYRYSTAHLKKRFRGFENKCITARWTNDRTRPRDGREKKRGCILKQKQVWSRQTSDASTPFVTPSSPPLPHPRPFPHLPLAYRSRKHAFSRFREKRVTDGPTDGRMDQRTDRPSYRDTWTHLKTG